MLWQIVVLLVLLWIYYGHHKNRRFIQFSKCFKNDYKTLPLIGHAYLFCGDGEVRMTAFQLLGRQALKHGGAAGAWFCRKFYVVITDPVDLDVVMKTSFEKATIMQFARNLIGNGSIFAPVPIWRPRRKVLAPTFSLKNLNKFMKIFNHQSRIMVDKLQKQVGAGPFSIWGYTSTFTMDAISETALGVKLNAQSHSDQPFLTAMDRCLYLITMRMVQPWLHFKFILSKLPLYKEFKTCKKIVYDFIDEIIVSKRKTMKGNINDESQEEQDDGRWKTLLELFIESSGGYTDVELREEILVILTAGTDTSAVGISFTLLMLSRHLDVQEKLYQELQLVFENSERPVETEDFHKLKYLDAVIKETIRLYPPGPIMDRYIEKDLKLPSGQTLLKGCGVMVNVWAVHRNTKYWGDDAEGFRPERFFDSPPKHPAAFQAFSYGPRSCIGEIISTIECIDVYSIDTNVHIRGHSSIT
ncbi:hypothetical protein O3G_MSEX011031 [Manduca sexta]|uniref:Cytochrome P450 n=1 Tax=Manduca sexta TaxID=7130 RepID=A0A921ZJ31_MANSE|nr:hypothetical protein O3G_MSEX011031 [Manduca sexta]